MTRARPGALRGTPTTIAADALLRVRVPSALIVLLREVADRRGTTVSALVRSCIVGEIGEGI